MRIFTKSQQAYGAFNNGEIVENKPLGFPQDGGALKPYSNLFYWANAEAKKESTIGLHPHQGFEIMSFVLNGTIKHFDTKLNDWRTLNKGDVQIIRAGNGISHKEYMAQDARMFQIWADPNLAKTLEKEASYDDYKSSSFPVREMEGGRITQLIGEDSPLTLDTPNFEICRIKVDTTFILEKSESEVLSIYNLDGNFSFDNQSVSKDDFVLVENENQVEINGMGELFVIKSLKQLSYQTYAQIMRSRMQNN